MYRDEIEGWWKVPKKKKKLKRKRKRKPLQKDECMISPPLSLSLLTQVNMSTPNIGKHVGITFEDAGQTCWTCSL